MTTEQNPLGRTVWDASRADEGSISATGADIVAAAVAVRLSDMVREDFDHQLAAEGSTRDSTMAVRGWLKGKGLWVGPDFNGEEQGDD